MSGSGRKELKEGRMKTCILRVVAFKEDYGVATQVPFILDCRPIRDPNREIDFRDKDGTDPEVRDRVLSHPMAEMLIQHGIEVIRYRLFEEMKEQTEIGVACNMGKHRSVAIAYEIARRLQELYPSVVIKVIRRKVE